jgi:hypothetical protein
LPLGLESSGGSRDHRNGDEADRNADGTREPRSNVQRAELFVLI